MKNKSLIILILIPILFTGCVSKMIGGAVDIATLGLVKEDHRSQQQDILINHKISKDIVKSS
jgi:hypothetical protein